METPPCEIWLTENIRCIVSPEDFEWARQWCWGVTWNSTKKKAYATRMTRERGTRKQVKIYLHKEILVRSGKVRPGPTYRMGDHQDGESLNNRRGNLEWATPSINRQTAGGFHARRQALWQ